MGVVRYAGFGAIVDVGYWQAVGIVDGLAGPGREDEGEVRRDVTSDLIALYDEAAFGVGEEVDAVVVACDAEHHLGVGHIRDIAADVPAEVLGVVLCEEVLELCLEGLRVFLPHGEVARPRIAYVGVCAVGLERVAEPGLGAHSAGLTGNDWRQGDVWHLP